MKFRWRGGTKGFIARSASRAVRRELSRPGGGERASNSCSLLIILFIGIPLAIVLLQILMIPVVLIFELLQKNLLLSIVLIGSFFVGIFGVVYLQKKRYIESAINWLSRTFRKITKIERFILSALAILAVILCATLVIVVIVTTI
jgi:hypothetical protein